MRGTHSKARQTNALRVLTLALMAAGLLAANVSWAASVTITTQGQFGIGDYTNTNSTEPPVGHVKLNEAILTPFNHIWVALSGRNAAVRINTDVDPTTIGDGNTTLTTAEAGGTAVLGEYLTRPNGRAGNPSRTTVDENGDVWVGNRNESSGGLGSITKISASPTGTTSNGIFNDAANGGVPGTFNRLPWSNAGLADDNGGVTTASDSALLRYVRTTGANVRHVTVDADNNVWAGGGPLDTGDQVFQLYNGATGAAIPNVPPPTTFFPDNNTGGYGGLVDGNGILWSAGLFGNSLTRIDPATGGRLTVNQNGRQSYGMGIDNNGIIWVSTWTNNTLDRINPDGTVANSYNLNVVNGGVNLRGVAVTPDNDIWVASSGSNRVIRVNNDGTIQTFITVGLQPTGVAVDSNGKVWVTNLDSDSVMRINPATNAVDLTIQLGFDADPYNYSDMTGTVLAGSTDPVGMWSRILDGGSGAVWDEIFWNTEAEASIPAGTSIVLEARVSNDQLNWSAFMAYASGDDLNLSGRFLELRATLSGTSTATPILSDISINFTPTQQPIPEPGTLALLSGGLLGLIWLRRRKVI